MTTLIRHRSWQLLGGCAIACLVLASCSDGSSAPETAEPEAAATTIPAETLPSPTTPPVVDAPPTAVVESPPPSLDEIRTLLVAFGGAWQAGDWDTLSGISAASVVDFARQQGELELFDGAVVTVPQDVSQPDACFTTTDGSIDCTVIFQPPESFGFIFGVVMAPSDSGLRVVDLIARGDTG